MCAVFVYYNSSPPRLHDYSIRYCKVGQWCANVCYVLAKLLTRSTLNKLGQWCVHMCYVIFDMFHTKPLVHTSIQVYDDL